jgi:glutathione S-transferase
MCDQWMSKMSKATRLQPSLQLLYFDVPGKAEAIRLACVYSGVKFDDIRMTREEFMVKKTTGELP